MRKFDFDVTLFGMSVTAVPDRDDQNKINVLINPIAVSSKKPETFEMVDNLKSTQSFHLDDFPEMFACFVHVVNILKKLEKRQAASCDQAKVPHRKVAVILGQDSRQPINADLLSTLLFGHEVDTETRIKDFEEKVEGDKELLERATASYLKSFTYQLDQMLEYVLPRLTTSELKQSTCNAFNDALADDEWGKDYLPSPIVPEDLDDKNALAEKIIAAARIKYHSDYNNHMFNSMRYETDLNTFLYDIKNGSLARRAHSFCQYIAENVAEEEDKFALLNFLSGVLECGYALTDCLFERGINPQKEFPVALMRASNNDPAILEMLVDTLLLPHVIIAPCCRFIHSSGAERP